MVSASSCRRARTVRKMVKAEKDINKVRGGAGHAGGGEGVGEVALTRGAPERRAGCKSGCCAPPPRALGSSARKLTEPVLARACCGELLRGAAVRAIAASSSPSAR